MEDVFDILERGRHFDLPLSSVSDSTSGSGAFALSAQSGATVGDASVSLSSALPKPRHWDFSPSASSTSPVTGSHGGLAADELEDWPGSPSRFRSFGHESLELRWQQLSMTHRQRSRRQRKEIQILKDVSGSAKPGHLTCVLGPSGSGKTTLLNVLAGRQIDGPRSGIQLTGRVLAADTPINPRMFRSRIAYVMQKDEMFATATPREALIFSAALRLPRCSEVGRDELVSELLGSLGLVQCADTFIGNAVINGLSGGQRKRTAIGVELVTRPEIVCLDEPTSGLDSYSAYQVMRVLKDLASKGCTVICTLHQPSSEIFALVDHVICLCHGRCFYDGEREHMASYFAKVGYSCPVGFNPADFVIFLLQTAQGERLDLLLQRWQAASGGAAKGSAMRDSELRTPLLGAKHLPSGHLFAPTPTKSFSTQLSSLILRELRSAVRDKTTLGVRFCLSVVLAGLFGMIFQGVGRTILEEEQQTIFELMWTGLSTEEVHALRKQKLEWHFNALVQVALVAMFSACQPTILAFPLERPVFLREHSGGTYGVLPYYMSKMAVEVPLVFVQSLLTLSLCYVMMELNGDFWCLLLTMVLLSICSVSVALAIGCMVRMPRETGAIGPLVFVPQMLFSGVFIPVRYIPSSLRWMQYSCFLQYAIKVLGIVEFQSIPHRQVLLKSQDIDEEAIVLYISLLVSLVVIFSLCGIAMLHQKAMHLFY